MVKEIQMSQLESIIWHTLGYMAIPTIFVFGFIGVFLAAVGVMKISGNKPVKD